MASAPLSTRMTRDERRDHILDAARGVFARRGYHAASTAEIASAAGCSEPMLYKHFASKQELFLAVLQHTGLTIRNRVLAAVTDAEHPLQALAEVSTELLNDPRWVELMRMRILALTMADDPVIGVAMRSASAHHSATIAGVMRQAQEIGDIRVDVDPDMIGWISVSISLLAAFRSALEGDEGLRDTARVMRALVTLVSTEEPTP